MKMVNTKVYAIDVRLIQRPQRPSRKGPYGMFFLPSLRLAMSEIGSR